ncbi:hypothetical protein CHUAL_001708 [Chamberlinius hualienensis]
MIGDESNGEYNLQIKNANLGDDSEFQCQVGPLGDVKEIWASSRLQVMLPPITVEIVTKDGYMGGTYVVTQHESLQLTCTVKEGKPAATIKWFKNSHELKIDNERYEVEDVGRKRQNARSKIRLHPTPDDNGATFACKGFHPALSVPISAQFKLNVQFPPATPEITGYQLGEVVRMGSSVTLTCLSRGGNPLPQLIWYKNNVVVDYSYTTSGKESVNTLQFEADGTDNGAIYLCKASNNVTTTPKFASINMTVHYGPAKVSIKGPSEAKKGDAVTMKCETGKSYPPANISWVVDGSPILTSTSSIQKSEDGWITTSEIVITISNQDRNTMLFSCYATHETLGQTIVDTYSLTILHPPNPPIIAGYREGTAVKAGNSLKMTCISTGGNPPPTLKWYKRGKEMTVSQRETKGDVVSAEISLLAEAQDNQAEFQCKSSNAATKTPLIASVKVSVNFPPVGVNISVTPHRAKAGRKITLQCDSASSHPEAEIHWWRNGIRLETAKYNGSQIGLYGGKSARSILRIDTTAAHDGTVYTCQAVNKALEHSVHDAVTLNILYKPEFLNPPSGAVIVEEGKSTIINMTAKGNPSTITYKWKRNGEELTSTPKNLTSMLHVIGPILNVSVTAKNERGNYTCEATNEEGTTSYTIFLDVHYSAIVTKITPRLVTEEGSIAHLECEGDGNPKPTNYLVWKRDGYDMSKLKQTYKHGKAYLDIPNANRTDTGHFKCVANNGIGSSSEKSTTLIVKYKPVVDKTSPYSKAAGEQGQKAKLNCRAQGAPNITFSWSRQGVQYTSNSKYKMETQQVDLITWDGFLYISNVQTKDYGEYECVARNELGFAVWKIKLDGTGLPDPPVSIKAINATHNSVFLEWTPGFDGGLPQSYRIRYKSSSSLVYQFTNVFPKNTTFYYVTNLDKSTEYTFSIMAYNDKGNSNYTTEIVTIKTSDKVENGKVLTHVLRGKGEIPRIVIITVSVVGTFLLVLNVTLVVCFIRRRHKKRMEDGELAKSSLMKQLIKGSNITCGNSIVGAESSEQSSSKAATIEMYAPSSYNGTITGETLSSISEKSETYSEDNITEEYLDDGCKSSATYLTDPMPNHHPYPNDGSTYIGFRNDLGSRHNTLTRSHNKTHGSNMYDVRPDDVNYADALRKNAYNHTMGDKILYVKTPPNPPHRSISSKEAYFNNKSPEARYVPYPVNSVPLQPLLSTFNPNPQEMSTTPLVSPQGTDAPPGLLPEMAGHLV